MQAPQTELPLAASANILIQEIGAETLVYKLDTHQYFHLNKISTLVWQNCDGRKPIDQIAADVGKTLNQAVSEDLVWLTLESLENQALITGRLTTPAKFNGLSRRQVIKEIGLAAGAVALPLVVSMVAPRALNAQSPGGVPGNVDVCSGGEGGVGEDTRKTPNGGLCNGHGNCCSNNCCPTGGGQGVCIPAGATCLG
jgi:hypothetical protein